MVSETWEFLTLPFRHYVRTSAEWRCARSDRHKVSFSITPHWINAQVSAHCNFIRRGGIPRATPSRVEYMWAGRVETLHKPPNTQFELTPWCAAVICSLPSQRKKQWKTPLLTGFTAYFVTHGHPFLHLFWHLVMPMHPYCTQQQHT